MLNVDGLKVRYGMIEALKGVSLNLGENEIVALIGANGAGKSTLLKAIVGLLPKAEGTITYRNLDMTKASCQAVVKNRIVLIPEGRHIFPDMNVHENLLMGAYLNHDKHQVQKDLNRVYGYFPRLFERRHQDGATLSGGEQQMLAMGRGLMANPKILLLDEPSMGLAPMLVQEIFHIIKTINKEDTTILLVEQNARMALSIADRAYILKNGEIALESDAKALMQSEDIKKAYLGG